MKTALLALALGSTLLFLPQEGPPVPEVGQPAPAFRLNDHNGYAAEVGGASDTWTIVAFYPKALTPG